MLYWSSIIMIFLGNKTSRLAILGSPQNNAINKTPALQKMHSKSNALLNYHYYVNL